MLDIDFHSQPVQQLERHHHPLTFSHLDAAFQDLNKVIQINRHDKDVRDLKSLLMYGLSKGYVRK